MVSTQAGTSFPYYEERSDDTCTALPSVAVQVSNDMLSNYQ